MRPNLLFPDDGTPMGHLGFDPAWDEPDQDEQNDQSPLVVLCFYGAGTAMIPAGIIAPDPRYKSGSPNQPQSPLRP